MSERWAVRQCEHGHLLQTSEFLCPRCQTVLSEEFEVVRAMNARASDPSTSKQAAFANEPRRDSQRGRALTAIMHAGDVGMTALEVQRATGIVGVWKRISELKQGGHVRVVGTRVDPETKAAGEVFVACRRS